MKKLNFFDLLTMAVGATIGSGIFAILGFAIGMTGRSVNLAILLASVFVLFMCVPYVFITGVTELKGGWYTHGKILLGERLGALAGLFLLFSMLNVAIYSISMVDYLAQLFPFFGDYHIFFSILILVVFFVISISGTKNMAKFQSLIVVALLASLAMFILFGIPKIKPGYFSNPGFMLNGPFKFFSAAALLTFASVGANTLLNFYDAAENPSKHIPWAMIIATLVVGFIYFGVGMVAAGVLPYKMTANQPLGIVASKILPSPLFVVFILGGAILAFASTLNSMLAYIKFPIMEIAEDGYLPKALLKVDQKYDYPYILMGVIFILAVLPIITGLNAADIVKVTLAPGYILFAALCFQTIKIPVLFPEKWEVSPFKVPKPILVVLSISAMLIFILQGVLLFLDLSVTLKSLNVIVGIGGVFYVYKRGDQLKKLRNQSPIIFDT